MATSIMIHDVTSVTTNATPHYSNNNAVTLRICSEGYNTGQCDITLFGLPTEAAEHITRALSVSSSMSEDAIRADERAKVTARLTALIGGAA